MKKVGVGGCVRYRAAALFFVPQEAFSVREGQIEVVPRASLVLAMIAGAFCFYAPPRKGKE